MGRKFDKFRLLMWKNWVLLKRRPIHSLFEILYPVLLIILLVAVKSLINVEKKDAKTYQPYTIDSFPLNFPGSVGVSPDIPLFQSFCSKNALNCIAYKTAAEMNTKIDNFNDTLEAAIQLDDTFNETTVPSSLNIVIRLLSENDIAEREIWYTNLLYPAFQTPGPRSPDDDIGGEPGKI